MITVLWNRNRSLFPLCRIQEQMYRSTGCGSVFPYMWHPHRTPFASSHPCEELPNPLRTNGCPVFLKNNSSFITDTLCKVTMQTTFLLFVSNLHIWQIKEHFDRISPPLFCCSTNHRTNLRAGVYFIFIILLSTAFSTTFREGEWGRTASTSKKISKANNHPSEF